MITDVETLGAKYNITDEDGRFIRTLQVVTQTEILEATVGPYEGSGFSDYESYLKASIKALSGFDGLGPEHTLWYATYSDDVVLYEIIEEALEYGYERVILEHLEPLYE